MIKSHIEQIFRCIPSIDIEVLKALDLSIDKGVARDKLTELYLNLSEAFKEWIG